jgi:hypothetical protein
MEGPETLASVPLRDVMTVPPLSAKLTVAPFAVALTDPSEPMSNVGADCGPFRVKVALAVTVAVNPRPNGIGPEVDEILSDVDTVPERTTTEVVVAPFLVVVVVAKAE